MSFWCDFTLYRNIGDYLVFVTTLVWCQITSSLWWQVKIEPLTLHDAGKSLNVWVRLLPIGPKDHMQKGYCMARSSLLPTWGRSKTLRVWMRLGRANRTHAKELLYDAFSPVGHGRERWILEGVGEAATYEPIDHMSKEVHIMLVVCVLTCLYGGIMSLWHFLLCGDLSYGLGWPFRFLEQCCYAYAIYIYIMWFHGDHFNLKLWVALFNHSYHVIIENDLVVFS